MRLVPLCDRAGGVRAYAKVDESDGRALVCWSWSLHSAGYAVRTEGGRSVLMHRQIMGLEAGDPNEVDHWDGDGLNNRRSNLRVAAHGPNQRNRQGPNANSTSGHRGVQWNGQRNNWKAEVRVEGRKKYLGSYDSPEAAAVAVEEFLR